MLTPDRSTQQPSPTEPSWPCAGAEPPPPEGHRAVQLLCDLGVALCESGTPAHRLEESLTRAASVLRVEASFFAMPTAVFASFDQLGLGIARLLRVQSAETHLSRLIELGCILDDVLAHRLQPAEGNLYARLTGNPAAIPLLPGVLLLVPGSVGVRSVQSFVANDALGGVATAFEMIYIAISIVAGLLIANAAMPSKRPL